MPMAVGVAVMSGGATVRRMAGDDRLGADGVDGSAPRLGGVAAVADHATERAERLRARPPFAPAAFWRARTLVPSRNTSPSSGRPLSRRSSKARAQIPIRDLRMCSCAAFHHGPSAGGTARHFAPLRWRQITASTVRRSSANGRPVPDRAASSAAFNRRQSASSRIVIPRQHTNSQPVL